ncbi:type II secretion system protein N [Candidatus Enterovibrio altilux]|uniref:Type II secretion system protein N n=1 Tax=Candidatus Enterovibrio altilux TaxID=1927128 RepID=A0A291B927_9GAMM|nr:type II secretion system protein N [Candidatus Enterovibrio luxaltus]ATF09487.1 General secretion pathway protein N [Candidatus Enterovibrio luxaltus]
MKDKGHISVVFVLVLLISVIAHIPANFALRYIPQIPGLEFHSISGTVWNGTVQEFRWQSQSFGNLHWTFNWLSVLIGNAGVSLCLSGLPGLSGCGNVGYEINGLYVSNLFLSVPATFIQPYVPYTLPVNLSGQFDLAIRNYTFKKAFCDTLDGRLVWSQSNIITPLSEVDYGLIAAKLSCNEGHLVIASDNESGALRTKFNVVFNPDQHYSINGWFIPGEELPEGIKSQLSWLGQLDNEGRYKLNTSY